MASLKLFPIFDYLITIYRASNNTVFSFLMNGDPLKVDCRHANQFSSVFFKSPNIIKTNRKREKKQNNEYGKYFENIICSINQSNVNNRIKL